MKKSLDELYKLALGGDLKKEDLEGIEELFGKDWENNKIDIGSYAEAEEFYNENLDEGLKNDYAYGILYYFWVEVEPTAKNGFKIEFSGRYVNGYRWIAEGCGRGDGNSEKFSFDITHEVKNEFKKMGLDLDKAVDDINLRCALSQAAITCIKRAEIAYLKESAV